MRVKMLLFASYRDLAGASEVDVEMPAHATAREAVVRLRGMGPELQRIPDTPAIAINLEYAPLDTNLNEGDVVALIPPVAGG